MISELITGTNFLICWSILFVILAVTIEFNILRKKDNWIKRQALAGEKKHIGFGAFFIMNWNIFWTAIFISLIFIVMIGGGYSLIKDIIVHWKEILKAIGWTIIVGLSIYVMIKIKHIMYKSFLKNNPTRDPANKLKRKVRVKAKKTTKKKVRK